MPNIAIALKAEIGRLARKELRAETESLKKAVAGYRKEIAALKRRVQLLERQQKVTASTAPIKQNGGETDSGLRFRASGLSAHRKRLGLSAREMGLLLDASPLSVYKWEAGQARPRAKHLTAIAAVRKLGKREVARRLSELTG